MSFYGLYDCEKEKLKAMMDLDGETFGFIDEDKVDSKYEFGMMELCYDSRIFDDYEERYYNSFFRNIVKEDYAPKKNECRTRAERRKNNHKKIRRKLKHGYMHLHDKPLNYLNKGKNFCSCSLCKVKTNPKGKTYFGRTKIRYSQRNWKSSDKRKIDMCKDKIEEYYLEDYYIMKDEYHNKYNFGDELENDYLIWLRDNKLRKLFEEWCSEDVLNRPYKFYIYNSDPFNSFKDFDEWLKLRM